MDVVLDVLLFLAIVVVAFCVGFGGAVLLDMYVHGSAGDDQQ